MTTLDLAKQAAASCSTGKRSVPVRNHSRKYPERTNRRRKRAAVDVGPGVPARLARFYDPIGNRRELGPEEEMAKDQGQSQWMPKLLTTDATTIPELMASEPKQTALGALGGGALGAGLGALLGRASGHQGLAAAAGGLGGAAFGGTALGLRQHGRNAELEESMRRLPPGATRRDLQAEELVDDAFARKYGFDLKSVAGSAVDLAKDNPVATGAVIGGLGEATAGYLGSDKHKLRNTLLSGLVGAGLGGLAGRGLARRYGNPQATADNWPGDIPTLPGASGVLKAHVGAQKIPQDPLPAYYKGGSARGPAGEYCPHCQARQERGDDGNCNRCHKPWPEKKASQRVCHCGTTMLGGFCPKCRTFVGHGKKADMMDLARTAGGWLSKNPGTAALGGAALGGGLGYLSDDDEHTGHRGMYGALLGGGLGLAGSALGGMVPAKPIPPTPSKPFSFKQVGNAATNAADRISTGAGKAVDTAGNWLNEQAAQGATDSKLKGVTQNVRDRIQSQGANYREVWPGQVPGQVAQEFQRDIADPLLAKGKPYKDVLHSRNMQAQNRLQTVPDTGAMDYAPGGAMDQARHLQGPYQPGHSARPVPGVYDQRNWGHEQPYQGPPKMSSDLFAVYFQKRSDMGMTSPGLAPAAPFGGGAGANPAPVGGAIGKATSALGPAAGPKPMAPTPPAPNTPAAGLVHGVSQPGHGGGYGAPAGGDMAPVPPPAPSQPQAGTVNGIGHAIMHPGETFDKAKNAVINYGTNQVIEHFKNDPAARQQIMDQLAPMVKNQAFGAIGNFADSILGIIPGMSPDVLKNMPPMQKAVILLGGLGLVGGGISAMMGGSGAATGTMAGLGGLALGVGLGGGNMGIGGFKKIWGGAGQGQQVSTNTPSSVLQRFNPTQPQQQPMAPAMARTPASVLPQGLGQSQPAYKA